MSSPTVVDIFAGAGGLSEGFKQAGFNILAAYEFHEDAIATYTRNHPNTLVKQKDIKLLTGKEILRDSKQKIVDILIGGPPCQGFSTYGKKKFNDTRNSLIQEYLRIVKELQPGIFVLENVPGLFKLYEGRYWTKIVETMKTLDYDIYAAVLRAADYAVPQLRKRLFIIGTNLGQPAIFPPFSNEKEAPEGLYTNHVKKPSKFVDFTPMKRDITIKEAINDLGFLRPGKKSDKYLKEPDSEYQKVLRTSNNRLYNHQAVRHSKRTIERFSLMEIGKGNDSLPKELQTNRISTRKLIPNAMCRTVTSSPEDFIHYKQPRIITVREMARIQTFPDRYEFLGPRTTGGLNRRTSCVQPQQLGNAVPPFLAQAVAEGITEMIKFDPANKMSNLLDRFKCSMNYN